MNKIYLNQLCPRIFLQRSDLKSGVWRKDVTLEKGKVYLIEAQSGSGKSSLCSYLSGYRDDYEGSLLFDQREARRLKVNDWTEIRKQHISLLFQDLRLFPELTAYENIAIKNQLTHHKTEGQIKEWLDALGIIDKCDTLVGRMSFGQQQRVAMIRALVQPFDFILADEPISHLDEQNARLMANVLMGEVREQQAGVVVTSIGNHLPLDYDEIFQL